MRSVLNFYSAISTPMHEHESYDEQMELVDNIGANLTNLEESLNAAIPTLENLEKVHHLAATTSLEDTDK